MSQIVTLLFTDLAGSSALLHQLGDEAAEDTRRVHFGILREAVAGYGGEEVKNLGDGLMVVFESAAAASRAAIGMQQAMSRHNGAGGPELGVRVGLHVGEPIRDEDDYFGAAVVVAKRLCDSAEAGQIVVSSMVHGLIASKAEFGLAPLPPVALKGMGEIDAYALEWRPRTVAARNRVDEHSLIGRGEHVAHLERQLEAATGGELRVVLVAGDAGMGKTRLASELLRRHRDRVVALSARAYPLGATSSLGLWIEALERHLRTIAREDVLSLCGGDPARLAGLLPTVAAATGQHRADEAPRIQMLGALAGLLHRLSERAVIVVVFDDVHLADGSSWEALNYLCRNLAESRILIVLIARPTELAEHPVAGEVIRALDQEGMVTRRTVEPLSAAEIGDLAADLIGGPAPTTLVAWLDERARGIPLFVGGLVRALLEEGADLDYPVLRSLPEDLAERVDARVRVLDPADRSIIELLAVAGNRVELGDLMRLSGRSLDDLAAILERLGRVRLVAEVEHGRDLAYEIGHPLIQEAIYAGIGGARRRALHRHAARVLVEGGRYGTAASHVARAADPGDDEAIGTLCEALRRAEAGGHHREEIALLDALLELVPAGDRRWRDVLHALPVTPEWVVDHRADVGSDVVVRAMRRADQVLDRSADTAYRAAVKFSLGSLLVWGQCDVAEGREHVERARELFAEAGDERAVMLATNELGYLEGIADHCGRHEETARTVLASAVRSGDSVLQLQALCSLAWSLQMAGRVAECLPVLDRGIEVARREEKVYRSTYLQALHVFVRHALGDGEAANGLGPIKDLDPAYRDTMFLDFAAQIAWLNGDLAAAVTACRDQIAWDGGTSPRRLLGVSMAAMCLADSGRHQEAAELNAMAEAVVGGHAWWAHSRIAAWSGAMAAALAGAGRGLDRLRTVAEDSVACGYWGWGRLIVADFAEEAFWARDADAGIAAAELLARDPWPPGGSSHAGLRALVEGVGRAAQGEAEPAAAQFEAAIAGFGRAGWRLFEGRARALHGSALARIDRERATRSLREAAAALEGCGSVVRRDRALAALDGLGARGRRAKVGLVGPAALTARERDVAQLAAKGCTAREIADRLFVGERTVETHLANVYAKLGVASKVDLVRRAADLGL